MIILVTGGASGLGEAITRQLAGNKTHHVYFTFHQSEEKAGEIEAELPNTTAIHCDFQNEADLRNIQEKIGKLEIDVLVNNAYAGDFNQSHFHKIPPESFRAAFEANLVPTIAVTQAAINCFRKKKSGKIITILTSYLEDDMPPVGVAVYVANKAYLAELCKVWANENRKFNISSNMVSPSFMLTGMTRNLDERLIEQIKEKQPGGKLLTVEETAKTVDYFVNAPQEITGINLVVKSASHVV